MHGLVDLQKVAVKNVDQTLPDLLYLRANVLAEAVFLFHKCAHAHLAAQRLGTRGMHSWSLFNGYHAGYIGARGIMALLGIGLPGRLPVAGQFLIDVFPKPSAQRDVRLLAANAYSFSDFRIVHFKTPFSQEELWAAFLRVLRTARVGCWSGRAFEEMRTLSENARITRPRNAILYGATSWPLDDLLKDRNEADFLALVLTEFDAKEAGFLLRLSYNVYRLFEALMKDLAIDVGPVRVELDESRVAKDPTTLDLATYNGFVRVLESEDAASV